MGSAGLLRGRQYFLMDYKSTDRAEEYKKLMAAVKKGQEPDPIDEAYIGLSNGYECSFDFDPQMFVPDVSERHAGAAASGTRAALELTQAEELEHKHFSEYLLERALTIDVWNGDSGMHFGTCKVPLFLLMRQGEPSKVIGQEFDVIESEFAERVGGL